MDQVISPIILYGALALGALGVAIALPRKSGNPQLVGALIGMAAGGLMLLGLAFKAREHIPNLYFYIFSIIALGSSLRVITHPRPVYAALYFILTILSSAGLYVILAAEFMAFALVIVYAGAILITYLFVIMLATQAPSEDQTDALADYDRASREPVGATVVGFVLLAVLTTMLFRGAVELPTPSAGNSSDAMLATLPRKVQTSLRRADLLEPGERIAPSGSDGTPAIDVAGGTITVMDADRNTRVIPRAQWPADLQVENVEGVGITLLRDHPGTIEIAGVILLMAMLGAVVLARKQVQLDEDAKARHADYLSAATDADMSAGLGGPGAASPGGSI